MFFTICWAILEAFGSFFGDIFGNCFGTQKGNARMEQDAANCGRMRPRGCQNAEEFGSGQEFPSPLYRFLTEIFAGCPAEKDLRRPLGALAVQPWVQEFLYTATWQFFIGFGTRENKGIGLTKLSLMSGAREA